MSIDKKTLDLQQIAIDVEKMVNRFIQEAISITYEQLTEGSMAFDAWQAKYFGLEPGGEYFFITRQHHLLYAVNVSSDSILTAASELMDKIAKKF